MLRLQAYYRSRSGLAERKQLHALLTYRGANSSAAGSSSSSSSSYLEAGTAAAKVYSNGISTIALP